MKLLMTVDAVGGVWTYALELSRALAEHDVDVVLACMGPAPQTSQVESASALSNVKLTVQECKLEWMAEPWADVAHAGDWLLQLADNERVDVIHLNGYVHAALPWGRPVVCVAHSCVYSWWQAVHGCDPPAEWQIYRERVAAGLNHADCVVAPTRAFVQVLREIYRPARRMLVIHNGRSSGTRPAQQRSPVIFACGRTWDRAKGMDVLDAATCDLPWRAWVAGPATAPHGVSVELKSLRNLGELPAADVQAWLRCAAIFAHPARYEPFGLSVLEAALGGCALVLSDLPTLRELWQGAAVFVPINDAWSLRAALAALIADPELVGVLGGASLLRARQYRPDIMAAQYAGLYRELLDPSRQPVREVA